ncbi:MAG: hypothetical protein WCA23_32740 [Stellaceae bacterium]
MFKDVEIKHGSEGPRRFELIEGAGDDTTGERQLTILDPLNKPRGKPAIGLDTDPVSNVVFEQERHMPTDARADVNNRFADIRPDERCYVRFPIRSRSKEL